MYDWKHTPPPDHSWTTHGGHHVKVEIIPVDGQPGAWRAVAHGDTDGDAAAVGPLLLRLASMGQNETAALSGERQAEIERMCRLLWADGDTVGAFLVACLRGVRP